MRNYSCVCRLQLRRSLPSVVKLKSQIAFDVVFSTEFNEPISCPDGDLLVNLIHHDDDKEDEYFTPSDLRIDLIKSDIVRVKFQAPSKPGKYAVSLRQPFEHLEASCFILPLETEAFLLVGADDLALLQSAKALLRSYRSLQCGPDIVRIAEEYGSTIGSHIYDSSVVMLRFIAENSSYLSDLISTDKSDDSTCNILELGAGCGVAGIWLSSFLSQQIKRRDELKGNHLAIPTSPVEGGPAVTIQVGRRCVAQVNVHLTDKRAQLPLLAENVALNQAVVDPTRVHIFCAELDWGSDQQIRAFEAHCGGPLRLILAGDVFYDREAVKQFIAVVQNLSTSGITKVLVAQKLRKNADNVAVALISEEQIRLEFGYEDIKLVREEADVRIWLMTAN